MSSRRVQDMSLRCLQDVLETSKMFTGMSVSKKSKSVSGKSISHLSIHDKSRWIQNALISTELLWYSSHFETQTVFIF